MSGTWSRKRRVATAPAPTTSAASQRQPLTELPMPAELQRQQQLLSRSTEKMFEEAEQSGVLSLSGRMLKDFPSTMAKKYDISDVVAADLSCNRLMEMPLDLCECRSLETLRITKNVLRRVSSDISLLSCLSYLDLSNNQLSTLPLSIFDLPLEILLLTGNRLETIPREIRQLSSTLTELDLSHNFLKTIPADIALLKVLRVLNLKKNQLDQFPSELCRLSLHILDLSSNKFTQLPLHLRKMKTLVELVIDDNPLQSPPADIVRKGRMHIFKWMETASGCGHVATARPHHSSSALKSLNMGRSAYASFTSSDSLRKASVPAPIERRSRATRFNTLGGSDSGYASTADEHRLSHELGPSGLDGINEYTVFSPSPDEGIQVAENENEVRSESISLNSQDSSKDEQKSKSSTSTDTNLVSLMKVYDQTMAPTAEPPSIAKSVQRPSPNATPVPAPQPQPPPVVVPLAVPEETETPKHTKAVSNGNEKEEVRAPKPSTLDVKNNNLVKPKTSTTTSPPKTLNVSKTTTAPSIPTPTKPVSKVAPMVNGTRAVSAPKTAPKISPPKAAQPAKTSSVPPAKTSSAPPNRSKPVLSSTKTTSSTTTVRKAMPPAVQKQTRLPTSASTRSPISSVVAPKTRKVSDSQSSASSRTSSAAPKKVAPIKATSVEPSTSTAAGIECLRKTFQERIAVNLSPIRDSLAMQLCDGVHLCNLMNALRPRMVPTIVNSANSTAISPLKAKRNAENFVAACRKVGVPDSSLCSAADIVAKRNLLLITKTVAHLSKLFPTDEPLVSHV